MQTAKPALGYFRIPAKEGNFTLILPAIFHKTTSFNWLKQFRENLSDKPNYVPTSKIKVRR